MPKNIDARFYGEEHLEVQPKEKSTEKDPRYALNPIHPLRFYRTVKDGIIYLDYILHGGPL